MPKLKTRIPVWLTIDLSVIAISVILIGVGFWIGVSDGWRSPLHEKTSRAEQIYSGVSPGERRP